MFDNFFENLRQMHIDRLLGDQPGREEPQQETLEEAAKSNYDNKTARIPVPTSHWINSEFLQIQNFKEGAKWQQERMYSEAIEFAEWIRIKDFQTASKDNWIGLDMKYYTTEELFEQFKKK